MNQTVTVNISGIVFHIEIDAYETLKAYLNKIKSYFRDAEESEEIMNDIEARIAELFNEKITTQNQVVNTKDVDEVITIMGKPEQYIDEDDAQEQQKARFSTNTRAHHSAKKLFRDPDGRVIGGVASGIAAYFGINIIWVRLAFILLASFTVIPYILLWIIMPEAKTTSDKLQMKGDPVNIDNLSKTFKDEADKVSNHFKNNGQQYGKKIETAFESLFSFVGQLLKGIFKFFGKFFGVLFLIVGLIFLTSSILWLTVGDKRILSISNDGVFGAVQSPALFDLMFPSSDMYHLFLLMFIVVIGIPFISLIYAGLKLLFNVKTHFSVGLSMFILWVVGVVCCAFFALNVATDQNNKDNVFVNDVLVDKFSDYQLTLLNEEIDGKEILMTKNLKILTDNNLIYINDVNLDIKQSETTDVKIQLQYESRGATKKDAREKANAINYKYLVEDSVISLSDFLAVPKEDRIRAQEVNITILLPVGKTIFIDNSLKDVIYDIDNITNTHDSNMLGKKWVMLKEGLTCLDCNKIEGITTTQLDSLRKFDIRL